MAISGDYLRNVPLPHTRKWPGSPDKRDVSARVGRYWGIGKHYHVAVHEEHNPIWDCRDAGEWGRPGEEMGWRECWDDPEGQGKVFEKVFDFRGQADDFIEEIIAEHFPPETHAVYINAMYAREYFYTREGD